MEAWLGIFLTIKLSFLIVGVLSISTTTLAASQALPNCNETCGSLKVPFPFGMTDDCAYQKSFFVNCRHATDPPIAYLGKNGTIVVTNISLETGELQISSLIARKCYNESGFNTESVNPRLRLSSTLTISHTKNKFIAVGCDTYAIFRGFRGKNMSVTGCMSVCNNVDNVDKNSCSGVGCCQTNIPIGLNNRIVRLASYNNHSGIWNFNPCSFAFIVETTQFNFSGESSFQSLSNTTRLPAVLNWAIGHESASCDAAKKNSTHYACKKNSECMKPLDRNGYICLCLSGYEGNPYHPDGCQDTDECKDRDLCINGKCNNTAGSYSCICSKGFKNYDMDSKKCIKENTTSKSKMTLLLTISLGISVGLLLLFMGISWICCGIKRRQFIKLKEKYFKENGGLLLLQQLASNGGSVETTKVFTAEELEKATDNYDDSRVLGEGGYGTVYKGVLPDNRVVAIKKSKGGTSTQSEQFVNEVIVLSQINHKNVVKLLGCCLEMEVPLLVYEFITHGTLHEHIHKKVSLSFELRMKIAVETAEALAYLHYSTSNPIIHRDVKAANILLDDTYTAKVSDFGASRLVPSGQTEIKTIVLGTLGYLDPEYLQSNQLTEKSDVYSFGVVLVELLTSRVPLSSNKCLASIFLSSMDGNCLDQILDENIVNEGNIETVKNVASLAKRCLRVKGEERPTMKEVAVELEGMRITAKHPWGYNVNSHPEENECLLGSLNSDCYSVGVTGRDCSSITGTTPAYDSMQIQMLMPYGNGR